MIEFQDRIRSGAAVAGEPRRKVEQLFPEQDEMDRWLRRDQEQYLNALAQAVGPFLKSSTTPEQEASAREPAARVPERVKLRPELPGELLADTRG